MFHSRNPMSEPLHVFIDTSPLQNTNAIRGVGVYTRLLTQALQKRKSIQIFSDFNLVKNERIDVTHYPYFDLFFPTLPLHKKTKTVVTIHDVIPLVFLKQYKPGLKGLLKLLRQRIALRSVDAVITDSEASQKDILKYLRLRAAKVHVVYLAANPDLKPVTEIEFQNVSRHYHLPEKYILYVGDINYNKNLAQLIKALKYLPEEIHLVCVGKNFMPQEIPEWKVVETQLALSDVTQRVQFISEVGGDATAVLSAIYSGAEVYVQPSLYEGFGLPVLEAMNCKTPVVCAQNSSLMEVGGEFVKYVQTDAESIAQGVKEVLEWSPAKRARWVGEALDWAQHFSWPKTADKTIEVYKSII